MALTEKAIGYCCKRWWWAVEQEEAFSARGATHSAERARSSAYYWHHRAEAIALRRERARLRCALRLWQAAEAQWVLCMCLDCEASHRPPCHRVEDALNNARYVREGVLP